MNLPTVVSLQVQPNPLRGMGYVTFTLPEGRAVALDLFNLSGKWVRRVFRGFADGKTGYRQPVDVTGLPAGTYFIRLTDSGGQQLMASLQLVVVP